jgi:AcrR family transcriptional regulator
MGRKPIKKARIENPEVKKKWILTLMPHFTAKGFSCFTMDELAKIIGVSKATFYKYFTSKDQLIEELLALKIAQMGEHKEILTDLTIPYEDRFLIVLEASANSLTDLSNNFLYDLKQEFPGKYRMIHDFKKLSLMFLREFYSQAQRDGYLESGFSPDAMVIVDGLVFSGADDPELLTLKDFYFQYFAIKLGGIMPAYRFNAFKLKLEELSRKMDSEARKSELV